VRSRAPARCSPRAFWRNDVIPSKAFTPECCNWEYSEDRLRVIHMQCLFPLCEEAPEPFPHKGRSCSFSSCSYVPHSSFRSEEGWVAPYYPRWASIDVPRELQAGKSKCMPESHSIGVGWWPYGHISKIPEGSHGGCRNRSIGSEGSVPPSMGSHSRDTRMGLEYDW